MQASQEYNLGTNTILPAWHEIELKLKLIRFFIRNDL